MTLDLSAPRRVHIVGIGGMAMSGIAAVLTRLGHTVSGSDLKAWRGLERLRLLGVDVHVPHDAACLPAELDAVVVSTAIPASSRPKLVLLFIIDAYFLDRNVHTCMRVVLCQTKNGLPSFLALSMNSHELLTSTSSNVVMSYFAFRKGRSCMLGTFDMSGNGGSGPSSTILCLPTRPQRGCSVESSVSVA